MPLIHSICMVADRLLYPTLKKVAVFTQLQARRSLDNHNVDHGNSELRKPENFS